MPSVKYSRHVSVVMMNAGGTGRVSLAISHKLAPLPPRIIWCIKRVKRRIKFRGVTGGGGGLKGGTTRYHSINSIHCLLFCFVWWPCMAIVYSITVGFSPT